MRPRHQLGQIAKRGSNWVLRYHEDRIIDGKVKRVRTSQVLAPYSDYPFKVNKSNDQVRSALNSKISAILSGVNSARGSIEGTLTLAEFIDQRYFPRLTERLAIPSGNELHIEPSTVKSYRDIMKVHVRESAAAKVQIRNFTPKTGQQFLESLPQKLSHQTHLRIKNFLRGVFTFAITSEAFVGANPMEETKAGGQSKKSGTAGMSVRQKKIRASHEHAYTLEEVADMLDKLPEPARTVCAVAAFTGLTRSELRGLKWADYDGETISVQRKIWGDYVGAPKTDAREAGVYVVPVLRKILAKYKEGFPAGTEDWMFRGEKFLRPLDLDNLSRREIPKFIDGGWFGWHAFRRGLGTRLNAAGVNDKDIQSILRHADVSTTQAYYILPSVEGAQAGLKKLDKTLRTKYGIKG
jgi:integrase